MVLSKQTRIGIMLVIDICFFLLELVSGIMVHSLALTADAFHMLNDIITLLIGLWAVKIAQRASTDRYSYGWVRAEILGAFFNAVFLIALCVTIILDAITRFIDPTEVTNPKMMLIVGCAGLVSNLLGFLVLGGHGHMHGHDHEHDHDHSHSDAHSEAEEGRAYSGHHCSTEHPSTVTGNGTAANEARNTSLDTVRNIHFDGSRTSPTKSHDRRGSSSNKHGRHSIDDITIHPSSFRQSIIRQTNIPSSFDNLDDDDSAADDEPVADENTPLVVKLGRGAVCSSAAHRTPYPSSNSTQDELLHKEHNHSKPKDPSKKSHGHGHGDMGMQGMILHVIGDFFGNLGVVATALIIWFTDGTWKYYADPAVSLFITAIILRSAMPLTLSTAKVLLQATPEEITISELKEDIEALPGIASCHHIHIWQLSDTKKVASMHVRMNFHITDEGGAHYHFLTKQVRRCLHGHGIHSANIQPEFCLQRNCEHSRDPASKDPRVSQCLMTDDGRGAASCCEDCVNGCFSQGCCPSRPTSRSSSSSSRHDGAHGS